MNNMFNGAKAFNTCIKDWSVKVGTTTTNMLLDSGLNISDPIANPATPDPVTYFTNC